MLQLLAGKKDTALYCSKWEVQLFCDFTVLETGDMHGERYLVPVSYTHLTLPTNSLV